jgi:hypothetical protein
MVSIFFDFFKHELLFIIVYPAITCRTRWQESGTYTIFAPDLLYSHLLAPFALDDSGA